MDLKTPIFIPRIDDKNLSLIFSPPPAILIDAQINTWRKNTVAEYKNKNVKVIINPSTHRIQYENAQNKNYKKLPYYIKPSEVESIYSNPTFRLSNLVQPCIKYQIDNGADIILAPFLHSDENHSRPFNTNLTMISESIKNSDILNGKLPLYAVINVSCHMLDSISSINYIVSMYRNDKFKDLSGYFILIDGFKEKEVSEQSIRGLSKLVYSLSIYKDVIVNYVGGFGDALCAIGASGIVSGLWYGNAMTIKELDVNDEDAGKMKKNRTYIPELFTYMNDDDVKKIRYSCKCIVCDGSFPINIADKKVHYYLRRSDIIDKMYDLKKEDRLEFIISEIEKALVIGKGYVDDFAIKINNIYLHRWLSVLKEVRNWKNPEEEDKEVEKLLSIIDRNRKNDSSNS